VPANRTILDTFTADKSADIPVYRQLIGQINCIIHTKQLVSGETLPTIRQLASQLNINPNTVVRAYEELQSAGVISKRRGSGCVVAASVKPLNSKTREALLSDQIEQLVFKSSELGVSTAELMRMIGSRSGKPVARKKQSAAAISPAPTPSPADGPDSESPSIWQPDDEFID
jgi:GntR family transcriptional regulator